MCRAGALANLFDVLFHLKVEHAHAKEIRAAVEGIPKAVCGLNGPGRQDLEGDPGLFQVAHEFHRLGGALAPDVVAFRLGLGGPAISLTV